MRNSMISSLALIAIFFASCEKDGNKPVHEHEEELITTVKVVFTSLAGGDTIIFSSTDLDGDGAQEPVVVNGTLKDSTVYQVSVEFLNELHQPAVEINEEVLAESHEHQVFFQFSPGLNITHTYEDMDIHGNPIGLENIVSTASSGNGEMKVILRHQPDKNAEGVSEGEILNAHGSTDAEVDFEVVVE